MNTASGGAGWLRKIIRKYREDRIYEDSLGMEKVLFDRRI